jgi:biopolymer transport protein ExbB
MILPQALFASLRDRAAGLARRALPALAVLAVGTAPLFAQEGAAPAAPATGGGMSVYQVIRASGWIGIGIIVLSIVALAMIIEMMVSLKRDKLAPPELIDEIQALFDSGEYQEAMELCENEPNFFTRVCGAGIAKIGHSFDVIEQSIIEMGDEESIRLHQRIGWLATIANVAPMMGLFGTVSGMIKAFNVIAATGGQASPADLAGGISEALITTFEGLLVAIPTSVAFAYMRNRLVRTVIEVGAIVEDLFERFRPGHTA